MIYKTKIEVLSIGYNVFYIKRPDRPSLMAGDMMSIHYPNDTSESIIPDISSTQYGTNGTSYTNTTMSRRTMLIAYDEDLHVGKIMGMFYINMCYNVYSYLYTQLQNLFS